MKVIFICGSLEPGKDGVGDYTRRLCGELLRQGVKVGMLAYNDKHVLNKIDAFQMSDGYSMPCLRLSHTMKSSERTKEAKNWIALHHPEWLSLQFVPYAFNNKGLPIGVGRSLQELAGNSKWHVMIHELWIGMSQQSSIKEKCIGQMQKLIIKQLLSRLAPKAIHTQTELYKYQLQNLGFSASILPLFSNIPFLKPDVDTNEGLSKFKLPEKYLVVFGAIHKQAPIDAFVRELNDWDTDKSFSFVALGRNGGELEHWKSIFEKYGFNVMVLGEQPMENISLVLSRAALGLATTPHALIEKSGSVAAMHEHSLPVICFSKPWLPINFERKSEVKGVIEYRMGNLKECIANVDRIAAQDIHIVQVAKLFLNALTH